MPKSKTRIGVLRKLTSVSARRFMLTSGPVNTSRARETDSAIRNIHVSVLAEICSAIMMFG
jgi:hypothetical protein